MVWVHKFDSTFLPMLVIFVEVCSANLLPVSVTLGEVFVVFNLNSYRGKFKRNSGITMEYGNKKYVLLEFALG